MERVGNLNLFLISVGLLGVSFHLVWCCLLVCCILPLLCLGMFLVFLLSPRPLSWRDAVFCWWPFQHLIRWSLWFLFFSLFIWWITYRFLYAEPSLHLWDEADLIKVNDFYNLFLDLICQYFIEYLCINVHEWNWSIILFLSNVFMWFGYQGNYSLVKRIWKCSFCSYCVEQFQEYWY